MKTYKKVYHITNKPQAIRYGNIHTGGTFWTFTATCNISDLLPGVCHIVNVTMDVTTSGTVKNRNNGKIYTMVVPRSTYNREQIAITPIDSVEQNDIGLFRGLSDPIRTFLGELTTNGDTSIVNNVVDINVNSDVNETHIDAYLTRKNNTNEIGLWWRGCPEVGYDVENGADFVAEVVLTFDDVRITVEYTVPNSVSRFDGDGWKLCAVYRFNGDEWEKCVVHRYDGVSWILCSGG